MAVDLATLIKQSVSELKFVITTHNPLFYNVLSNELGNSNKETGYKSNNHFLKYSLDKTENNLYELKKESDTTFSYHIFLLNELINSVESGDIYKYHFNFLRNVFEKTATFLGYKNWWDLLEFVKGEKELYIRRILNLSSHSKHAGEEVTKITNDDKKMFEYLLKGFLDTYRFKVDIKEGNDELL